jgi:hypothetical protein
MLRNGARSLHAATGKEELVVGVYVDNLIVTGARTEDIDGFKPEMAARFRMSDLIELSYYLGIEVKQGSDSISLGQRAYAEKLLERGSTADCKPVRNWSAVAWQTASHVQLQWRKG